MSDKGGCGHGVVWYKRETQKPQQSLEAQEQRRSGLTIAGRRDGAAKVPGEAK